MRVGKYTIIVCSCFLNLFSFVRISMANTVHAIPSHLGDEIKAYEILELINVGQLQYKEKYTDLKYNVSVDISIDSRSGFMAVTFEGSNELELINARTLIREAIITAQEADDLAGIDRKSVV